MLNDQKGEAIYAVMLAGRFEKGMPKFSLSLDNASDIAAYVHCIPVGRGAKAAFDPKSILVGDAAAAFLLVLPYRVTRSAGVIDVQLTV